MYGIIGSSLGNVVGIMTRHLRECQQARYHKATVQSLGTNHYFSLMCPPSLALDPSSFPPWGRGENEGIQLKKGSGEDSFTILTYTEYLLFCNGAFLLTVHNSTISVTYPTAYLPPVHNDLPTVLVLKYNAALTLLHTPSPGLSIWHNKWL